MIALWILQYYVFLIKNKLKVTYHVLTIWNHNHKLGIMIPYHSPEVLNGVQKGMLGDDEFIALVITLQNQRQDKKPYKIKDKKNKSWHRTRQRNMFYVKVVYFKC